MYHESVGPLVEAVAREGERAYARVSFSLDHQLQDKMPRILVTTDADVQDAVAVARQSGAPDRNRVVLSLETFERRPVTVAHELTHQFVFELLPDVPPGLAWVPEVLADYQSGDTVDAANLAMMREAIAAGRVPRIENLTSGDRLWGRTIFDYIAAQYGAQGLRRFINALRSRGATGQAVQEAFGHSVVEFNRRFQT